MDRYNSIGMSLEEFEVWASNRYIVWNHWEKEEETYKRWPVRFIEWKSNSFTGFIGEDIKGNRTHYSFEGTVEGHWIAVPDVLIDPHPEYDHNGVNLKSLTVSMEDYKRLLGQYRAMHDQYKAAIAESVNKSKRTLRKRDE